MESVPCKFLRGHSSFNNYIHWKVTFWKETVIVSIKFGVCIDINKRMQQSLYFQKWTEGYHWFHKIGKSLESQVNFMYVFKPTKLVNLVYCLSFEKNHIKMSYVKARKKIEWQKKKKKKLLLSIMLTKTGQKLITINSIVMLQVWIRVYRAGWAPPHGHCQCHLQQASHNGCLWRPGLWWEFYTGKVLGSAF